MRVTTVHVSWPSLATLHGGAFAATTVHVARNSVTTVHGGKFSLAPLQPGASVTESSPKLDMTYFSAAGGCPLDVSGIELRDSSADG